MPGYGRTRPACKGVLQARPASLARTKAEAEARSYVGAGFTRVHLRPSPGAEAEARSNVGAGFTPARGSLGADGSAMRLVLAWRRRRGAGCPFAPALCALFDYKLSPVSRKG